MKAIMKNLIKAKVLVLSTLALLVCGNLSAKQYPTVTGKLQTVGVTTVSIGTASATNSIEVVPVGGTKDYHILNTIALKFDLHTDTFFASPAEVRVKVSIDRWDETGTPMSNRTEYLKVTTDNRTGNAMLQQSLIKLTDGYKVEVTIDSIWVNNISKNTLPRYVWVESEINMDRYYDFSSSVSTGVSFDELIPVNNDCDTIDEELSVVWNPNVMAEEYQLEWVFVNNYSASGTGAYSPASYVADFKHNSTRVTVYDNNYNISLLYDKGYLAFRLRAVGRNYLNPSEYIYGPWTSADTVNLSLLTNLENRYTVSGEHEKNKNWQYSSTFAEEGKKKEVISYFDGSLRNRQSVTKTNSNDLVIVGETIYDYQGRPAVNILPVPVIDTCSDPGAAPSIKYYPKFNVDEADSVYSKNDFDLDASSCVSTAGPLDTVSGASQYYSSNNPNLLNQQAFLPHARKYPFTQVEYTPDNTGRIRAQSGVGKDHQLGSGKETIYLYGQPNQVQVDRLFGSEAGDASHYKKNTVIDANGQASVTYMDQGGKTIATSLAGLAPTEIGGATRLDSLEYANANQKFFTVDLFNKDDNGISKLNKLSPSGDEVAFSTQLLVSYKSLYEFNYNFKIDTLTDPCLKDNICINCIYNLDVRVTDACGYDLAAAELGGPASRVTGKVDTTGSVLTFSIHCSGASLYKDSVKFDLLLDPGVYTVSKVLSVNEDAKNFYVKNYLDTANNSCVKTFSYFHDAELAKIDTMDCYSSCSSCVAKLGNKDDFISSGRGNDVQYEYLLEQCTEPCRQQTLCKTTYDMMLSDVSPGGQYGKYNPTTYYAGDKPLSVFNTGNTLNANLAAGNSNWKHPRMRVNGTLHSLYLSSEGERTRVILTRDTANFIPPVDDTTLVYTDATTLEKYTYPENLRNLSDFIPVWSGGFAKSLVIYHPEYAYYVSCMDHGVVFPADTLSSDELDSLLFVTETFAQAVTNGFIDTAYKSSIIPALDKVTHIWNSTSGIYDPFFTNTDFVYTTSANAITGSKTTIPMLNGFQALRVDPATEMNNKITNYQLKGATYYNMAQVAAILARCGTSYGAPPSGPCLDFGTDYFPSPSPQQAIWNDSIRNLEWRFFKNFYYSEKQKIQFRRMEFYAKHLDDTNSNYYGGSNACFGTSDYNPVLSKILVPAPGGFGWMGFPYSIFYDISQPCSYYTWAEYAGVQKRFYDPANSGLSTDNVAQQVYEQTGQCPLAFQLQGFLNGMAQTHRLTRTPYTSLDSVYEFTPDLYLAVSGGIAPPAYVPYQYSVTSTSGSTIAVSFINPNTSATECTLKIKTTGTAITDLDSIVGISQLLPNPAGGTGAFTAVAVYISGGTMHSANITGNSCINIKDCSFEPVCTPNQFAIDIQSLLNVLAAYDTLTSTTPVSLSTDTNFAYFITPSIKSALGTPNSNLMYVFNSPKFTFYDSLNTSTKIEISFLGFTGTITDIAGFSNINTNGNNLFTAQLSDSTGANAGAFFMKINKVTATDTIGISMGKCGLPDPLECQQKGHLVRKDLEVAVKAILTQKPFNSDINGIIFSNLLKSYALDSLLTTVYHTDTSAVLNYDTLLIYGSDSSAFCHFRLTHLRTNGSRNNFNEIVNIKNLKGIGNADIAGNYYDFMAIATYTTNTGFATDTIYGTSCWPIKNCDACMLPEDTLDMYHDGFDEDYTGPSTLYYPAVHEEDCEVTTVQTFINYYINLYNLSVYADQTNYTLTPIGTSGVEGYCRCYKTYIDYLSIYVAADSASVPGLPVPLSIEKFDGCNDGSHCSDMYTRYLKAVADYNTAMSTRDLPTIDTLYSSTTFINQYCYCAKKFINNLYGVIAGSIPQGLPNITNIDSACVKPPCTHTIDSTISVPTFTTYTNPCVVQMKNLAAINAANAYQQYIDSMTTDIAGRYTRHCLSAAENFKYRYVDKEYHFTLYYYDQAGNLIKTIPPEGVEPLNITASTDALSQQINYGRTNNLQTVYTAHRMPTKYVYNSLNQLTYQAMPDHDNMDICDGNNPRGLDSGLIVTGVQFLPGSGKGYLSGYLFVDSRLMRGYLYTTNDGGQNWTKVNGLVSGDLQKVTFTNSGIYGHAISTNGMLLRSKDSGNNWDLVTGLYQPASGTRYVNTLTALIMSATNGIVAGINDGTNPFFYYTADSCKSFAAGSVTGSVAGDTITSISALTGTYVASARNGLIGKLFKSADGVNWSLVTSFTGNHYTKVQYVSSTLAVVAGEEGNLFKTTTTLQGQQIPTGTTATIRDVHFKNEIYGIALIDSVPGKAKIWKTFDGGVTWNVLSSPGDYYKSLKYYDSTKVIAVGDTGLVARVLMSTPPFGLIKLTAPNPDDYSTADAVTLSGGNLLSIVASASSDSVHMTYNGNNSSPVWLTKDVTALVSPVPSPHATFKKLLISVSNTVTPDINALLLTNTGRLYSLSRAYNSTYVSCDTVNITGSMSGKFFNDITSNTQVGTVMFYAYDTTARALHRISFTDTVANGTLLGNSSAITGVVRSIDLSDGSDEILLAGDNGYLNYGEDVSLSTVAWRDTSAFMKPCALNEVQLYGTSAMAVGADGNTWIIAGNADNWYLRNSGTAENLTGLSMVNATAKGLVVGNHGKMLAVSSATGFNPVFSNVSSLVTGNYTDVDISASGKAAAVTADGKFMAMTSYSVPVLFPVPSPATSFNGVSFKNNSFAYAVGNNASVYLCSANIAIAMKGLYTGPVTSMHFYDANNGYLIDTCNVIRRTTNGGLSWSVVLPPSGSKYMTKIYCPKPNQAVLVGKTSLAAVVNGNTYSALSVPSLTGTVNFQELNFNPAKNYGVIVGSNGRALSLVPNGSGYTVASLGQVGFNTNLRAVHVFDNNSFIAAGSKGKIYYYKGGTYTPQIAYTAPAGLTQNDITFLDIFFHDNYTGYVVGSAGAAFKVNLGDSIASAGTTSNSLNWNSLCSQALDLGYSTNTQLRKMNFTGIAFSTRSKAMIVGLDSNIVINTSFTPGRYARLIKEESGYFSTRFWYDRLGRLVLSQNTKQINKSNPDSAEVKRAYSYTLYDALGRITEVGEKFENLDSAGLRFNNIFGSMVNSYFNVNTINDSTYLDWINSNGSRREVTKTYYDVQNIFDNTIALQQNLRKRVASTSYEDIYDGYDSTYQHATHYSYDIHGNVNTLWQENPSLESIAQNIKRTDYEYDLISGKVNMVHYQSGRADAFHHHYEYDADNRITQVFTSNDIEGRWTGEQDDPLWTQDAKYFYYDHGPLARVEFGKDHVQGVDYAYTIQGWIKGVNSNLLNPDKDMGNDGKTGHVNEDFARDVFGYTLNYYKGDYTAVDATKWNNKATRFEAYHNSSDMMNHRNDLFNGNISSMVTTISRADTGKVDLASFPLGNAYRYDQLNRITRSSSYNNFDLDSNKLKNNNASLPGLYRNTFTYDANGNIKLQAKYDSLGVLMDSLVYQYEKINSKMQRNRLYHVNELNSSTTMSYDIEDQGHFTAALDSINRVNNYRYDEIGNLVRDSIEGIDTIRWTVYGKIKAIKRFSGNPKDNLYFDYDAFGNRVAKHVYTSANVWKNSTYYVRDAQGNVTSTYKYKPVGMDMSFKLQEQHLYGRSRLGLAKPDLEMIGVMDTLDTLKTYLGHKDYEFSNHLGNVLSVLSDKKSQVEDTTTATQLGHYVAGLNYATDYYPFGQTLPGRAYDVPNCYTDTTLVVDTVYYNDGTDISDWSSDGTVSSTGGKITLTGAYFSFFDGPDLEPNKTYTLSFDLNAGSCDPGIEMEIDWLSDDDGDVISFADYYGSGTYTYTFTAPSEPSYLYFGPYPLGDVCDYTFDNITLTTMAEHYEIVCNDNGAGGNKNKYRYGFNGQEKDDDVYGEGNSYTAEYWQYDPRLGRRWNIDPIVKPWESPYACFANSPIWYNDVKGDDASETGDKPKRKAKAPKVDNTPPKMTDNLLDEVVVYSEPESWSDKVGNFFKGIGNAIGTFLEDVNRKFKRDADNFFKNEWWNPIKWFEKDIVTTPDGNGHTQDRPNKSPQSEGNGVLDPNAPDDPYNYNEDPKNNSTSGPIDEDGWSIYPDESGNQYKRVTAGDVILFRNAKNKDTVMIFTPVKNYKDKNSPEWHEQVHMMKVLDELNNAPK